MRSGCLFLMILIVAAIAVLPPILAPRYSGEGEFIYENSSNAELNFSDIAAAASPIQAKGITVAVYVVPSGSHDDFRAQLDGNDLMTNTSSDTGVLAVYIGRNNRYSEIAWGAYDTINVAEIRRQSLNPELRDGRFTNAIVNTLNTSYQRIDNPYAVLIPTLLTSFDYINDAPEWLITTIIIVFMTLVGLIFRGRSGSSNDDKHHLFTSDSGGDFSSDSGGDSGSFDGGSWDD